MSFPASVANKGLTQRLNPLDATLTKNRGGGPVIVNQISEKEICPEEPPAVGDEGSRGDYNLFQKDGNIMSPLTVLIVKRG